MKTAIARMLVKRFPENYVRAIGALAGLSLLGCGSALADPTIVFATNWFAEAQHGGYYEALAKGIYKKFGLNVKVDMGGPGINGEQLLAAGKYQFYMGNAIDQLVATAHHLPLVTVAASDWTQVYPSSVGFWLNGPAKSCLLPFGSPVV